MWKRAKVLAIAAAVSAIVVGTRGVRASATREELSGEQAPHRELQAGADAVCQRLQAQILGAVECECQAITRGRFEFTCRSNRNVCTPLDVVCGTPSILGTVGLQSNAEAEDRTIGLLFQGAVCVSNIAIRKTELIAEPLCLQLPYEENPTGGSLILNWINALLGRVQSNDPGNGNVQSMECVATMGETECDSCSKCVGGHARGYVFNCSNVHSEMVASTCQPIQLVKSVRGRRKSVHLFVPQVDEAV